MHWLVIFAVISLCFTTEGKIQYFLKNILSILIMSSYILSILIIKYPDKYTVISTAQFCSANRGVRPTPEMEDLEVTPNGQCLTTLL